MSAQKTENKLIELIVMGTSISAIKQMKPLWQLALLVSAFLCCNKSTEFKNSNERKLR